MFRPKYESPLNDRDRKQTLLCGRSFAVLTGGCLFAVVAIALAQSPSQPAAKENPLGSSPQAIAEGNELYNHNCTGCHGVNGGAGERGPALAGDRSYVHDTDADIFATIQNGIAGTAMPPFNLPANDAWKIVAYIRSLRASAADAFVPGDVARGEQIFWNQARCGSCHMINGRGGLLGPDLSNLGGEHTLREIRAALTEPKREIPRGYRPAEVITKSGQHFSGILKNEDNFSLELLDMHEQLQLFTRDDLRDVQYRSASLMPADYNKTLPPADLQDLLAFLSRQARDKSEEEKEGEQ